MSGIDRSLAPPANFGVNAPPGVETPSAALGGVPGLDLSHGTSAVGGFGASSGALLSQLNGGLVRNVAGFPSQEVLVQAHVVKPWANNMHKRITRGQVLFIRRDANEAQTETIVTLPQMNSILRRAYGIAKRNGILERQTLDFDVWSDVQHAIAEDLEDELDRKRRLLDQSVQDKAQSENILDRIKNTNSKFHTTTEEYRKVLFADSNTQFLRYLSRDAILESWNYLGVCRNIEYQGQNFQMLNAAFGGPLHVDNYWGDGLHQGHYVYLNLTRRYNQAAKQYEEFQFMPWSQAASDDTRLQTKYPTDGDLTYTDEAGYEHRGVPYMIGKVGRVMANQKATRAKAKQLAGLGSSADPEADAWRETSRDKKSTVFLSLGKDAWDTAAF